MFKSFLVFTCGEIRFVETPWMMGLVFDANFGFVEARTHADPPHHFSIFELGLGWACVRGGARFAVGCGTVLQRLT
jgi:hypothetical protein